MTEAVENQGRFRTGCFGCDPEPPFFFFFFSKDSKRDDLLYTCYIQPQVRTELVQNVKGPGQRTKRDHFDTSKVGLPKVVEVIRMAIDVPDPLRQVLDSRQAVQQFVPASLASGFPCFCSCGFLEPPSFSPGQL